MIPNKIIPGIRKIFLCLVFSISASVALSQTFADTSELNTYIRDTIKDRRPDKISAAQIQKALLGITQFIGTGGTPEAKDTITSIEPILIDSTGPHNKDLKLRATWADSALAGGDVLTQYTPTVTPIANCSQSNLIYSTFIKSGNYIEVTFGFEAYATSTTLNCQFSVDLPVSVPYFGGIAPFGSGSAIVNVTDVIIPVVVDIQNSTTAVISLKASTASTQIIGSVRFQYQYLP